MPPKKAKPLTQKAEREMMGAEDIASTARELTDAQKRMAKAREAKKAKAVAPKKEENITLKIDEAPYGYTASGRKRSKPLKEKAPKAPKAPPPTAKKEAPPKENINININVGEKKGGAKVGGARPRPPPRPTTLKTLPPPLLRNILSYLPDDKGVKGWYLGGDDKKKTETFKEAVFKPKLLEELDYYTTWGEKGKYASYPQTEKERIYAEKSYYKNEDGKKDEARARAKQFTRARMAVITPLRSYYLENVRLGIPLSDIKDSDTRYDGVDLLLNDKSFMPQLREIVAKAVRPAVFKTEIEREATKSGKHSYPYMWSLTKKQIETYSKKREVKAKIKAVEDRIKETTTPQELVSIIDAYGADKRGIYEESYNLIGRKAVYGNHIDNRSRGENDEQEAKELEEMGIGEYQQVGRGLYEDDGMNSSDDDEEGGIDGNGLFGGALSAKELKGLLGASYDPKIDKVGDFVLDKSISTDTSKVYRNATSGQVVVAHRGTEGLLDWGNNAVYALGGKTAYKMTPRYKEAEKVQKKAEAKYGKQNISTIGHSQGGLQAELLGGKSKEIITLNKATRPFESNKNKNQYDVRSKGDVVSALNPFEKKSSKNVEIERGSYNPLKEHSGDILDRLEEDTMIGGAIRRVIEGGATPDQRAIAGVLRSRLKYVAQTELGQYRDVKIKSLLNAILHSTDTAEDFDDFARMNPNLPRNPYVDYTDTYDYVVPSSTVPLPSKVIDDALRAFYSFMTAPSNRKRLGERELFTKTLETYKSGNKEIDRDRDILINARMRKEGEIVEPTAPPTEAVLKTGGGGGGGGGGSETASTTSDAKAEKKRLKRLERIDMLKKKLEERRLWWMEPNNKKYEGIARILDALLRSIIAPKIPSTQEERQDTFNDKFVRFKGEWEKLEKEILDDVNAIFKITGKDGRITMADLVDYGFTPVGYKIVLDRKFDAVPMDGSQQSIEKRRTYGLIKNPYDAELEKKWKAPSGKGLPIPSPIVMGGAIDFEDMNWGSLTEQMKAYNNQHKKSFDLEGFARMIVAKPSDFQKRTLKRARFYLNVLLPKRKS